MNRSRLCSLPVALHVAGVTRGNIQQQRQRPAWIVQRALLFPHTDNNFGIDFSLFHPLLKLSLRPTNRPNVQGKLFQLGLASLVPHAAVTLPLLPPADRVLVARMKKKHNEEGVSITIEICVIHQYTSTQWFPNRPMPVCTRVIASLLSCVTHLHSHSFN